MCQKVHGISILEEDECCFLFFLLLLCIIYRLILHSFTLLEYVSNIYIYLYIYYSHGIYLTRLAPLLFLYTKDLYSHMYKYMDKNIVYLFSYTHSNCWENKEEIQTEKIFSLKNKHKSPRFHLVPCIFFCLFLGKFIPPNV